LIDTAGRLFCLPNPPLSRFAALPSSFVEALHHPSTPDRVATRIAARVPGSGSEHGKERPFPGRGGRLSPARAPSRRQPCFADSAAAAPVMGAAGEAARARRALHLARSLAKSDLRTLRPPARSVREPHRPGRRFRTPDPEGWSVHGGPSNEHARVADSVSRCRVRRFDWLFDRRRPAIRGGPAWRCAALRAARARWGTVPRAIRGLLA
jgi:hypothetical protein